MCLLLNERQSQSNQKQPKTQKNKRKNIEKLIKIHGYPLAQQRTGELPLLLSCVALLG